MLRLVFYTALLIGAVWLGVSVSADPGYAIFAFGHWTVEMPLWFAALSLIVASFLLVKLSRLVGLSQAATSHLHNWRERRHFRRSRQATNKGLMELAEGQWAKAERLLLQGARYSETPLINFLAAARAAQAQGIDARRDEYLRMAHSAMPEAEVAIGLAQAELQVRHSQYEQGLATLRHLRQLVPDHVYVLKLLKHLYVELQDWQGLYDLLPALRKHKVLGKQEHHELEVDVYSHLLLQAAHNPTIKSDAGTIWAGLPRHLKREPVLLESYAESLLQAGQDAEAVSLLSDYLPKCWNDSLIELYGRAKPNDKEHQLRIAERWLKQQPNNAALLLVLGRLCMRNHLWGKARTYLEASLNICQRPAVFVELGRLSEELSEPAKAMQYYRDGLVSAAVA